MSLEGCTSALHSSLLISSYVKNKIDYANSLNGQLVFWLKLSVCTKRPADSKLVSPLHCNVNFTNLKKRGIDRKKNGLTYKRCTCISNVYRYWLPFSSYPRLIGLPLLRPGFTLTLIRVTSKLTWKGKSRTVPEKRVVGSTHHPHREECSAHTHTGLWPLQWAEGKQHIYCQSRICS